MILKVDRRNTIPKDRYGSYTTYVGGHPSYIRTDNTVDLAVANTAVVIGLFYNNATKDTNVSANYNWSGATATATVRTTIIEFPHTVTLVAEADGTVPWNTTDTWNEADRVYVETGVGDWTNVNPSATVADDENNWGDVIEVVSSAGTVTELTIQFWRRD